jgi:soluble lytic murein transglycosylase-like protein
MKIPLIAVYDRFFLRMKIMGAREFIYDKKLFPLFVVFFLSVVPSAHSDIYRYTDSEGIIHITNAPTEKAPYVLILKEKRTAFKIIGNVSDYDSIIRKVSEKYNVDSTLVKAIIKAESNFNNKAVSPAGAKGLMQLMPATAASLKVCDSFHPEHNIEGGVRYLRYLSKLFNGDLPLVLAAYNAGENAVIRHNHTIPPYAETRNYVTRVLNYLKQYRND